MADTTTEEQQEVVQTKDVPYTLNSVAPQDLNDIPHDPAFLGSFKDPETAEIITSETMGIILQRFWKNIEEKTEDLEEEELTSEKMLELLQKSLAFLETENPGTNKLLNGKIDSTYGWIDSAVKAEIKNYLETNFQIEQPTEELIRTMFKMGLVSTIADETFFEYSSAPSTVENHEFAFIPTDDFDFKGFLKSMLGEYKAFIDPERAPGTPQEWAALIAYHELEHIADNGQKPLSNFVKNFDGSLGVFTPSTLKEIEADCAAFNAMNGLVSDEVKEYWIATRIATSLKDDIIRSNADNSEASSSHATGFHLAEFNATGHMPDYFAMQTNVNGFFSTVREKFKEPFDKLNIDSQTHDIYTNNLDNILALVIEMRDKKEFENPAQEQIAQQFITSLQDVLGVQPTKDWRAELRTDDLINQKPDSPDKAPEATASESTTKTRNDPEPPPAALPTP